MDELQEKLVKSIETITNELKKKLKFDYTIIGKIEENIEGNLYKVKYGNSDIEVKARDGLTLEIGDIVYIRVIKNKFQDKFIDCKKP